MRKLFSFILACGILPMVLSCKKDEVDPDKQIRIVILDANGFGDNTLTGFVLPDAFNIIKFNKAFYAGVDSIVLAGQVRSSDPAATCIVELVNVLDNVTYPGSQIKTQSPTMTVATSNNIFNDLPNKEITLSLRIRTDQEGNYVEANQISLFLYRSEKKKRKKLF